ncbi:hypothetical protein KBC03_01520 [Patescibacteria group bacterium]|nr:hypothetical protein [Patescibacteria group bacterium]
MNSPVLQPVVQAFNANKYVSPKDVVTATVQLLDLFNIVLDSETSKELIGLTKMKIEESMVGKTGVIVSSTLGSVPLYKENDRTKIAIFKIRNNLVAVMMGELADSAADHEQMVKTLDLPRHTSVKAPDRDGIYSAAA